ncbi:DNA-processing protein DprA [Candidatus Latescibacterota bacterium]
MKKPPREHLSCNQSEKTEYTSEEQPLPLYRSTPCVPEVIANQECGQPRSTKVPAGHVFFPLTLKQYLGDRAPHELYCFGNLSLLQEERTVMLCGSRSASESALGLTFRAARQLAEMRVAVTSGYARGVDMAAHQGALSAGGDTIAVLPYGINRFRVARPLREVFDIEHFLAASELHPTHHFTIK